MTPSWENCDIPYFYTLFDLQHRIQPWFPEVSKDGLWLRRETEYSEVLKRASRIIVPNQTAQLEVEKFYGLDSERFIINPHPFSVQELNQDSVAPTIPAPYVFYPAQFWPHKNHATLFRAICLLKAQGETVHLALTGSDLESQIELETLAKRLGIRDQVHFLGFVTKQELIGLYRNAVALTFPSVFGPENIPPLEAFYLGCPVISADYRGSEEQMSDAALRVSAYRDTEWVNSILKVKSDLALRKSLIEKGKDRVIGRTADDFVNRVFQELELFSMILTK